MQSLHIHYFKIGTASKNEKGANNISDMQFEANGAASSGPPEEELLMWKPESITTHNLEILRKQLNEKYEELCEIFCLNDHVDLCHTKKIGKIYT